MNCLKALGTQDCSALMAALNTCLAKKKQELSSKYGIQDGK
jgi:hypothetical protein